MVLSGAFVLMHLVSKVLAKPLVALGRRLGVNETAAMGLLSTLVTNATTLEMVNRMDKKGIILNSAFLVSAAFAIGSHVAFTMAYDTAYIFPMMIGKLTAGLSSLVVALVIYKRMNKQEEM